MTHCMELGYRKMLGRTPEIPFSLFSMILHTDQFLLGCFQMPKMSCSGLCVGKETQLGLSFNLIFLALIH